MGKIITICGDGKVGKSTIAINTAIALSEKDYLVGILNAKTSYGSVQRYLGKSVSESQCMTLGLSRPTAERVKSCVIHVPDPDIFITSLADNADVSKLTSINYEDAKTFLLTLNTFVDFLIVDGTDRLNDILMVAALAESAHVIEVIKPTIQGLTYHNAVIPPYIEDGIMDASKYRFLFNGYKPYVTKAHINDVCVGEPLLDIPFSYAVEESENTNIPVYQKKLDKKYCNAINTFANFLLGVEEQKKKRLFGKVGK